MVVLTLKKGGEYNSKEAAIYYKKIIQKENIRYFDIKTVAILQTFAWKKVSLNSELFLLCLLEAPRRSSGAWEVICHLLMPHISRMHKEEILVASRRSLRLLNFGLSIHTEWNPQVSTLIIHRCSLWEYIYNTRATEQVLINEQIVAFSLQWLSVFFKLYSCTLNRTKYLHFGRRFAISKEIAWLDESLKEYLQFQFWMLKKSIQTEVGVSFATVIVWKWIIHLREVLPRALESKTATKIKIK